MPLDKFVEMVQIWCRTGGWKPSASNCAGCLHPVNGKTCAFIKELVRDVRGSQCGTWFIVAKTDTAVGRAAARVKAFDVGG